MYNTIVRIYRNGMVTETGISKAVTLTWITEEEKAEIIQIVASEKATVSAQ